MFDAKIRPLIDPPLDRLARALAGSGVSANAVTLIGFAFGMGAAVAAALGAFWIGLALLLLNRLADGLDGALARRLGPTDFGGYLDIVLDFLVYAAIPVGFAHADPAANAPAAAVLIFSFIGTGASFLAYAILAAKRGVSTELRGRKSFYYLGGLTEGTETTVFLALCFLLPAQFALLAYVFAALCCITTVTRILAARAVFGGQQEGES
jgi:phosphatidylglycerophosphate synthase